MRNSQSSKYKNIIEVNTPNIVTQAGHPKVYYKIKPEVGYIVCSYSNTCFKLSKKANINSKEVFIYNG